MSIPMKTPYELAIAICPGVGNPTDEQVALCEEWIKQFITDREAQVVQREQEKVRHTGNVLLHEDDDGNIGGHMVVGCSGGADYVGDTETGYPRRIMVAPVKGKGHATYYHESVVQREREAAKGLVEVLEQYASVYNPNSFGAFWDLADGIETREGHKVYEARGTLQETAGPARRALATYNDNRKG